MIRTRRGVCRGVGRRDRESICAGLAFYSRTRFHYHTITITLSRFICRRVHFLFERSSQDEYETVFVQHRNAFNLMGVSHRDICSFVFKHGVEGRDWDAVQSTRTDKARKTGFIWCAFQWRPPLSIDYYCIYLNWTVRELCRIFP